MYKHLQKAWKHGGEFYCTSCGSQFEKDNENHFVSGVMAQEHMAKEHLSELRCFACDAVLVQSDHGGTRRGAGRPPKGRQTKLSPQDQLVAYARQIALYRGYTDLMNGLQPIERLREKYLAEIMEFKEALVSKTWLHALHESSDVLYYAACIDVQAASDLYVDALRECAQLLRFHGIRMSSAQIEAAALAKYEWRAVGSDNKDEAHELKLIEQAVSK